MITSLRLVNFKNFADETLRVGPFTVIIGTNASGKSNIRDAFRFLHGIGRGYALAEILGGKYGGGGQKEWDAIRGAPNEVLRLSPSDSFELSQFSIHCNFEHAGTESDYSITVGFDSLSPEVFRVKKEILNVGNNKIQSRNSNQNPGFWEFRREEERPEHFSQSQPFLQGSNPLETLGWYQDVAGSGLHAVLGNMRFFDWSPMRMREPSFPGIVTLGDSGENLPSVLRAISVDPVLKDVLNSWLQELTPTDVRGLEFSNDPSGRIHLYILESDGRKISAYSASDGTLRFLGMLAALLEKNSEGVYFFEEIENGIHPTRLWLLLELIEKQTEKGHVQVIGTTHSAEMLNYINDTTFENTSVVCRNEDSSESIIRTVSNLSNARELRASQGLGRLHSTGWMEDILAFSEPEDGNLEYEGPHNP